MFVDQNQPHRVGNDVCAPEASTPHLDLHVSGLGQTILMYQLPLCIYVKLSETRTSYTQMPY